VELGAETVVAVEVPVLQAQTGMCQVVPVVPAVIFLYGLANQAIRPFAEVVAEAVGLLAVLVVPVGAVQVGRIVLEPMEQQTLVEVAVEVQRLLVQLVVMAAQESSTFATGLRKLH